VIVVSDTSILLNLCRIGCEDVLPQLYGDVIAPETVRLEFESAVVRYPRFGGLAFPGWVRIEMPSRPLSSFEPHAQLDRGESDAIALAAELQADLILIDELAGRAVAKRLGLRPTGTLGVLIDAKQCGLLAAIGPLLDDLREQANFFLSDARRLEALRLAGESP
jgi:uncharacterized protein